MSTPSAQSASATQGVSVGSFQARRRASRPIVAPAASTHGAAPSVATMRNSSADSGTSPSGKRRARTMLSKWLSTTVYQANPGVAAAAATYHADAITTSPITPRRGSHARSGRTWPAAASARPTARVDHPREEQREADGERGDKERFRTHVAAVGEEAA